MSREYQRKWFYQAEWNEHVQLNKQICSELVFNNNKATNEPEKIVINQKVNTDTTNNTSSMNNSSHDLDTKFKFLSIPEISINKLLLNYFIIMGYENSSIRMCKELGIINSNKDIQDFNDLYMIQERNQIKNLIKSGKIMDAMDKILINFGSNALENGVDIYDYGNNNNNNNNMENGLNNSNEVDLQFKLLLLNLIEMIREHNRLKEINKNNNDISAINDNKFILDLINYSKEQLSSKASKNLQQMNELQLTMSLLLFTKTNTDNHELPRELNELYSLQFRSKIAEQINKKLLSLINVKVENQTKFPNLIFNHLNLNLNSLNLFQILNNKSDSKNIATKNKDKGNDTISKVKYDSSRDIPNHSINNIIPEQHVQTLGNTITNKTKYWSETQKYLNLDSSINSSMSTFDNGMLADNTNCNDRNKISGNTTCNRTVFDNNFESKLIQLFKLWCYSENTLHINNFGIPRVKDTFD